MVGVAATADLPLSAAMAAMAAGCSGSETAGTAGVAGILWSVEAEEMAGLRAYLAATVAWVATEERA
jgi:hypothetical protein